MVIIKRNNEGGKRKGAGRYKKRGGKGVKQKKNKDIAEQTDRDNLMKAVDLEERDMELRRGC